MGRAYLISGFTLMLLASGFTLMSLASCSTPQDLGGHSLADSVKAPFRKLHDRVVPKPKEAVLDTRPRYWVTALPKSQLSAQTLRPTLTRSVLLAIVPDADPILQAAGTDDSAIVITSVDGQQVRSFGTLFSVAAGIKDLQTPIELEWRSSAGQKGSADISRFQLLGLCHSIHPETVHRFGSGSALSVLLRDQGVHCVIKVRAERTLGLLHVSLQMEDVLRRGNLSDLDVRATCDSQRLQCLTCPEILAWTYSDAEFATPSADQCSFKVVQASEQYRMPTNFNSLVQKLQQDDGLSLRNKREPVFAVFNGRPYPSSPILGDARLLSTMLLKRRLNNADEADTQAGWIVFGGKQLRDGGEVEIEIDFGDGAIHVPFVIPPG